MRRGDDLRVRLGRSRDGGSGNSKPLVARVLASAERAGGIGTGQRGSARSSFGRGRAAAFAATRMLSRRSRGGVVAAVVWDHLGGMPGMRMMIDTVAVLSEGGRQLRSRYCFQPMMQPGEMERTFVQQGLADVTETELMIRMDYQNFDDYWAPIAAGEGPLGKYMATLDPAERVRTDVAVRDAYQAGQPDGPRSFANAAWACRGIVP